MINKKSTIAIIIPCFNEEKTIKQVIESYKKYVPYADIYVCNNNSTDNTKQMALKTGAIVFDELQKGKANAVENLFRNVIADYYILTDGDMTYDSSVSDYALNYLRKMNADMLVGVRKPHSSNNEIYRPGHKFGNKAFTFILRTIFSGNLKDVLSGYRIFTKRFVKSLPILSKGFDIEVEITIHALSLNLKICEYDINYFKRPEGSISKLSTFKDGFLIIKTIFKLIVDYKPFLLFSSIAVIMFLMGIFFFIPILRDFISTGLVERLPTAILSLGLIILSALSFFSGLILNGIARHRIETKKIALLKL
ncbi:glycosyltransferase family 2 protein [Alphaproteobacteria bacterium]|nr:glycosyltransferase family 2 protein [Alphaproteobacteria bacterium]